MIFFSLTEPPLPDPTLTPTNTSRFDRSRPKRTELYRNRPETNRNGLNWTCLKLSGWDWEGVCRDGGGGWGGCKGKRKSLLWLLPPWSSWGLDLNNCLEGGSSQKGIVQYPVWLWIFKPEIKIWGASSYEFLHGSLLFGNIVPFEIEVSSGFRLPRNQVNSKPSMSMCMCLYSKTSKSQHFPCIGYPKTSLGLTTKNTNNWSG